jgi:REP element-mobilizing transposase RayT
MARPLRINYEGAFHHITARGNERKKIFLSKADYDTFLNFLKDASHKYGIIIHCYALMGNHYHLVVETPRGLLSRFMHDINSGYTTYFNIKRKRAGHLFQGRYRSLLVEKDSYLLELSRYVHLNPCRAGIAERPEDYPLSSYRAYIHPDESTIVFRDLVLGMVSSDPQQAPTKYRMFVEEAINGEQPPFFKTYGGMILGSKEFIKESLEKIKEESLGKHETSGKRLLIVPPPDIQEIISFLALRHHVLEETIISSPPYRHYAIYLFRKYTTLTNSEIGQYFGIGIAAVTKAVTRLTCKMKADKKIEEEIRKIKKQLSLVNG